MKMIRKDDHRIHRERTLLLDRAEHVAQQGDFVNQGGGLAIRQINGEEIGAARNIKSAIA